MNLISMFSRQGKSHQICTLYGETNVDQMSAHDII